MHFTKAGADEAITPGIELLAHIRDAFGTDRKLWTKALLERLHDRDESPWKDIYGKPLDDRGLAKRLRQYGIKSKDIWIGETTRKGFEASQFHDTWKRLVPERDEGDEREEIDIKEQKPSPPSGPSGQVGGNGQDDDYPEPGSFEDDDLEIPEFLRRAAAA